MNNRDLRFTISPEAMDELQTRMDEPAKELPRLRNLLREESPPKRAAKIEVTRSFITDRMVSRYLPSRYVSSPECDGVIYIMGTDHAGWTLEEYVIPRLASGMVTAVQIDLDDIPDDALAALRDRWSDLENENLAH